MTERDQAISEARAMPLAELAQLVLRGCCVSGVDDVVLLDRCRAIDAAAAVKSKAYGVGGSGVAEQLLKSVGESNDY